MRICILLKIFTFVTLATGITEGNPCCSFPCQNKGVCMTRGSEQYYCDCTRTGYSGMNCEIPGLSERIKRWLKPSPETVQYMLQHHQWFWDIVNNFRFLSNFIIKKFFVVRAMKIDMPPTYESAHSYITLNAFYNLSVYTRVLPPVPRDCPTPMGVAGKKELPDIDTIVDKFFRRGKFIPDPAGTNVMFPFFAQHFSHQFLKTDYKRGPEFHWGRHSIDASTIYGPDEKAENLLRSFKDGKLKSQFVKGEEYPPLVKDAPVKMIYNEKVPDNFRFALGHEFFGSLPGLFMFATIWVREHNRVAGVLTTEHPEWDDERVFHTTKLIILGESLKIVLEDYVQHLTQYRFKLNFDPELIFDEPFQYQSRASLEFNYLYRWHPMMPSELYIANSTYKLEETLFRTDLLVKHGMKDFVESLTRQKAGNFGPVNHSPITIPVLKKLIEDGRALRFQSFTQYKKRFDMTPPKTFLELTGDDQIARDLEELYGDIDAVEFYVGFILEKKAPGNVFMISLFEMAAPMSVQGLMANPICSPKYWKPSTFGGDVGFSIVKTASLKKLFCANIQGDCPQISFQVPGFKGMKDRQKHGEL